MGSMDVMLTCGHAANSMMTRPGATEAKPGCVICLCDTVAETPGLDGRIMSCAYLPKGHADKPSSMRAAFFEHRPSKDTDEYYCGCRGWD